jgi:hypothetical protein
VNIFIHIDRLVLDGIDVPPGQRPLLQTTVEAELSRLIITGSLSSEILSGGAYREIQGSPIHLESVHTPTLGQQIARALYGGMSE